MTKQQQLHCVTICQIWSCLSNSTPWILQQNDSRLYGFPSKRFCCRRGCSTVVQQPPVFPHTDSYKSGSLEPSSVKHGAGIHWHMSKRSRQHKASNFVSISSRSSHAQLVSPPKYRATHLCCTCATGEFRIGPLHPHPLFGRRHRPGDISDYKHVGHPSYGDVFRILTFFSAKNTCSSSSNTLEKMN